MAAAAVAAPAPAAAADGKAPAVAAPAGAATVSASISVVAAGAAAPAAGAGAAAATGRKCQSPGCTNGSAMQECPTCLELKLPSTFYCSKECFKKAWPTHNQLHKDTKAARAYVAPKFAYTGPLRPHWVSPTLPVPAHIAKPEYYATGQPVSEMEARNAAKIHINSDKEIAAIRLACKIGRDVLDMAGRMVRPGVTTDEIDRAVHAATIAAGAYPSPLNYHNFPKSCCTSVNEVICHGIPDARPLQDGDIVNVDISVFKDGFHGDLNETYLVGANVDADSKRLIKTTYEALMAAVAEVKTNAMVRDFGATISKIVGKQNFSVVKTYCGHGIGAMFHGPPSVPHYARNKGIGTLKPGMVFTIEPMVNAGRSDDKLWAFDDWTSTTADGKRSAQFEHTLLVTENGVEILTARTPQSVPFFWEKPGAPVVPAVDNKTAAADAAAAAAFSLAPPAKAGAAATTTATTTAADGNAPEATAAAASTAAPAADGAAGAAGAAEGAKKKKKKKK